MKIIRVCLVVLSTLIFSQFVYAAEPDLHLPNNEFVAPKIKHDPVSRLKLEPGESITLYASVTDADGVETVTLYFRNNGDEDYARKRMVETISGNFAVKILAEEITNSGIEYFIEAVDGSGNRAFKGADFSPIRLSIRGASNPAQIASEAESQNSTTAKKSSNKWWWIAGGVLATGAALSVMNQDEEKKDDTTVTISGRVPSE